VARQRYSGREKEKELCCRVCLYWKRVMGKVNEERRLRREDGMRRPTSISYISLGAEPFAPAPHGGVSQKAEVPWIVAHVVRGRGWLRERNANLRLTIRMWAAAAGRHSTIL
jgi:hypothetical protein